MDQTTTAPATDTSSGEAGEAVARLVSVMARLRSDDGCPWDREQNWKTLRRYVIEEAHELVDAVDRDDPEAVREECGDLLLEVVFMAQIAADEGRFGMKEVAQDIAEKLIRRHPDVFASETRAADADEALASWEAIKAKEKADKRARGGASDDDLIGSLPKGLPALLVAMKVLERQDAPSHRADRGVANALARFETDREEAALGDLLFAVAAEAQRRGIDPEAALRNAARRAAAGDPTDGEPAA